jgi:hypothetical protein
VGWADAVIRSPGPDPSLHGLMLRKARMPHALNHPLGESRIELRHESSGLRGAGQQRRPTTSTTTATDPMPAHIPCRCRGVHSTARKSCPVPAPRPRCRLSSGESGSLWRSLSACCVQNGQGRREVLYVHQNRHHALCAAAGVLERSPLPREILPSDVCLGGQLPVLWVDAGGVSAAVDEHVRCRQGTVCQAVGEEVGPLLACSSH